eukprot:15473149-Alexandrium_andersonii.AAC.1
MESLSGCTCRARLLVVMFLFATSVATHFAGMSFRNAERGVSWLELYLDLLNVSGIGQVCQVGHRKPTLKEELVCFRGVVRK